MATYKTLFLHKQLLLLVSIWLLILYGSKPSSSADDDDIDHVCFSPSPYLEKFVQTLSFPTYINLDSSYSSVTLGAYKVSQKVHPNLPSTTLYAFGTSQEAAAFPGPTVLARQDVAAHVRWENHIKDEHHFLPQPNYVSALVEWANPRNGGVPVVAHLHGAEVPSIYDGHPDAWITAKNETGPTFATQDYVYPNEQPAAALWYHDHTLGITRLNVLAGLAGMYILRPSLEEEERLGLPDGAPLVFKDMRFYANGSLLLPGPPDFDTPHWCPEWFDVWLVNGKAWPYVHVLPRPYRFRLLNACNGRFIAFHLNVSNVPFIRIGTDGGFLPLPLQVDPYLLLSPGERADVIIDFSKLNPDIEVLLFNFAVEPLGTDEHYKPFTGPSSKVLLKFVITSHIGDALQDGLIDSSSRGYMDKLTDYMMDQHTLSSSYQKSTTHPQEGQVLWSNILPGTIVRQIPVITMRNTEGYTSEYFLGEKLRWSDPVDIIPEVGSYEIWEVINSGNMTHNFHVHLIQFKVLDEQSIDISSVVANNCSMKIPYPEVGTCFVNYPQIPSFYYVGWKDTFSLFAEMVVRILVHFKPRNCISFGFDVTLGPGYVLHCHIVQHEDHSMM